ncbi:hypothetical protein PL373_16080 [Tenacibaculum maritimum]|nr:hypothetical protein [Tenacibaculum maritimum]MDB0602620.1 hypothetical protein [Tenacibaculum maritimum]MDB0611268.1 hypothetical protein [Tenacibaculum maritimum]
MYLTEELALKKLKSNISAKHEMKIVEGLKRKGHEFTTSKELVVFIKTRCKVFDDIIKHEKIYYVDDSPFLYWKYKTEMEFKGGKLVASLGKWGFM